MEFKNTPYKHQLHYHNNYARRTGFALLADMGTGKTFMVINNVAELYGSGECDSLLVFAPNGVHTNWTRIELGKHMPDFVPYKAVAWQPNETKKFAAELEELFEPQHGKLRIFTMNWESLQTDRGFAIAKRFCETSGKLFIAADESHYIKNPAASRTKALMKLKPMAKYRRIMTGTPTDGCPFDLYSQFKFIDESILETDSFYAFKAEYAEMLPAEHRTIQRIAKNKIPWTEWEVGTIKKNVTETYKLLSKSDNEEFISQAEALLNFAECGDYKEVQETIAKIQGLFNPEVKSHGKTLVLNLFQEINTIIADHTAKVARVSSSRRMPQIVDKSKDGRPKYKNLDKLTKLIAPHSYRVLKSECLDLPEKVYKNVFFELTKEQRATYKRAEEELRLIFDGQETAINKLTAVTKLSQITSSYFISPLSPDPVRIAGNNPKLGALLSAVQSIVNSDNKTIIWARYTQEIKDIVAALKAEGIKCLEYYGETSKKDRQEAIEEFEHGDCQVFVGSAKAGGTGITLVSASYVIYYSNDYSLTSRSQSEDRAHRIGQTKSVTYINLIGKDTIDEAVVKCLLNKKDVENQIVNDGLKFISERL